MKHNIGIRSIIAAANEAACLEVVRRAWPFTKEPFGTNYSLRAQSSNHCVVARIRDWERMLLRALANDAAGGESSGNLTFA